MNILASSAGRRAKVIDYFRQTLGVQDSIIAADCDINAPALYFADDYEIIPRIDDPNYLDKLIEVCQKHHIDAVFSLIDPELEVLAKNKEKFEEINVTLILSPLEMIVKSFDKQKTYDYLSDVGVPSVPTYSSIEEVIQQLEFGRICFPLVIKPGKGSASIGIQTVHNLDDLNFIFSKENGLIIQPYYKHKEFGVDTYVDMITGELTDIFIKEKVKMRSGETDKSVSVNNLDIVDLVKNFVEKTDFIGPLDLDIFEYADSYYISEINPRFGGGYPHAYEMGSNFPQYIINNVSGKSNKSFSEYQYDQGYTLLKYDEVILKKFL
ncbi:ATP-grasp domain-containing protein [Aquisalibacillus elongatus]|uniref:Carbamoyl-phosphate synthase large subunit n=1 Tax=Aquisalibacillus elongatus TaxID=485577 RepID=A0A3N5C7A5_9BACI|nr:ATP-grasp domain-containing protein [Aquisalibacillus elongatus]RPF54215.1 carbamoyl-phosphate synthase large subunit [Aquisalibacillus elongatus]